MEPAPAPPTNAAPSKARTFCARLASTVVLWAIVSAAIWKNIPELIAVLIGLLGIGSAVEFFGLYRADESTRAYRRLGLALCIAYWLAQIIPILGGHPGAQGFWLDVAALVLALQGGFVLACRRAPEGEHTLHHIFSVVFGVLYTGVLFSFMLRLLYWTEGAGPPDTARGIFLTLFAIVVTKFCDTGAYCFGVLLGRHKMIPHISPAKSWEGLAGAFITGIGMSALLLWLFPGRLAPLDMRLGLVIAPVLCLVGVIGDLAESVLKRCTHIKDSGHTLPGIGGILDLTDSLLFTAPVLYAYLKWIS